MNRLFVAREALYVSKEISKAALSWAGERGIDGFIRGGEKSAEIAAKRARTALRIAGKVSSSVAALNNGSELARKNVSEGYEARLEEIEALLADNDNESVQSELKKYRGDKTKDYAKFCIINGISVTPKQRIMMLGHLLEGKTAIDEYDHVAEKLMVTSPVPAIIEAEHSLPIHNVIDLTEHRDMTPDVRAAAHEDSQGFIR